MSERVEYLGDYPTVDEYFRSRFLSRSWAPLVIPAGLWLLECLEPERIRVAIRGGGVFRYFVARGCVFRVSTDE